MRSQTFHKRFALALSRTDVDSTSLLRPVNSSDQQRRFNVYRNNRMVSLIDSLRSSYPAIHKLVGEEFFKASACAYIETQPPTQPVMAEYGNGFGQFMLALPGTDRFPYLADVAELEWQYLQSFHAADATVLDVAALSAVAPESIMYVSMQCHPALHVIASQWPVGSIWSSCLDRNSQSAETQSAETQSTDTQSRDTKTRDMQSGASIDMRQAETLVITRPGLQVQVNSVDSTAAIFLRAIQAGEMLAVAAEQALESDMTFDAGASLIGLIGLGAFSGINENQTYKP